MHPRMGVFLFIPMKENTNIQTIKVWVFPTLVSILAMMIWNDVNEIKGDVKALMAQSAIDKTRIDNLERVVFGNKSGNTNIPIDRRLPEPPYNLIAVIPPREELVAIKIKKKII
jgi:hypothetical protein